jgi:hypothetical protein
MEGRTVMAFSKLISWLLMVALAAQPALVAPCVCRAMSSQDSVGAAAKEHGCCGGTKTSRVVGVQRTANHRCCCCRGASCCNAKGRSQVPVPVSTTPSLRDSLDKSMLWTFCVQGLIADASKDTRPTSEARRPPVVFNSPNERCVALCRWLF